jgi:shikimate kinase
MTPDHRRLFLIGYRGTGKTMVARLLAERLGWGWADADEILEARSGRAVREIFSKEGETAFRDLEEAVLADLCQRPEHVIATGGGVILREANRQRLRQRGRVVWLTADPATIDARLRADRTTPHRRPPLAGGGQQEIEEMLCRREPLYRACADLTVSTDGRSPTDVVDAILSGLSLAPRTGVGVRPPQAPPPREAPCS